MQILSLHHLDFAWPVHPPRYTLQIDDLISPTKMTILVMDRLDIVIYMVYRRIALADRKACALCTPCLFHCSAG